jgi:hypothetical protein
MSQPQTPFTKAQLLPQEETLEVLKRKGGIIYWDSERESFSGKARLFNTGCGLCIECQRAQNSY